MDDTIERTSDEWQREHPDPVVYDPDGWDRVNFHYSWYQELITLGEYQRRLMHSTIMTRGPVES